jgi:hypothetical protein
MLMAGTNRQLTAKLSLLFAAAVSLCLPKMSLAQMPPSDSGNYAAKVVTAEGQVSVLRDAQPWALSLGDSVQVKELIITGPDGHAVFQVSDGSSFEVYPNARVVFRKNPPNWKDLLDVLVGRVRIHIEHFGSVPNPNRVLTPTAVISVRGTTFDVSVSDDDETTLIEVEEGVVEVRHALLPGNTPRMLTSGESLRVYRNEPLADRLVDKGTVARQVLRSVMDAISTAAMHTRTGGVGGAGGSGGGAVGDTGKKIPPPPPPPPPGPPPPPH